MRGGGRCSRPGTTPSCAWAAASPTSCSTTYGEGLWASPVHPAAGGLWRVLRTEAAAGWGRAPAEASARPKDGRPGAGVGPALAERRPRAVRGADAFLRDGRRAGPRRVLGRRRGRAGVDVPPAQRHSLERRHADHRRRLPPFLAEGAGADDRGGLRGACAGNRARGKALPRHGPRWARRRGNRRRDAARYPPAPGALVRPAGRLPDRRSGAATTDGVQRALPSRLPRGRPSRARTQRRLLERRSREAETANPERVREGRRRGASDGARGTG